MGIESFGRRVLALAVMASLGGMPALAAAQEDAPAEDEAGAEGEEAAPLSAMGQKLEQAKQQLEQLSYTGAQQTLFEIVRSGQATPEELAQAYFNLGIVEAALDHEVEATDSFYLGLMLEPSLLFPEGGSPKIRSRLNDARSRVTEVGVLEAKAAVDDGVLEVQIENDPLKLIRRVEVMMTRGGESGTVELKKNELRAEVEPGVESIQVLFYDEAGNRLKVLDVDPAGQASQALPAEAVGASSIWSSWGLWAGVAGALALGGTYFVMEAGDLDAEVGSAQNEPEPDRAEITRLADNRDRVALYGVVGLSMAGAAAVTAGALLLFGDDEPPVESEAGLEASLVPSFAPGHVGARFHLRF